MIDLDGRRLAVADYRGQVVVVNLWASWCGPCRAEIPGLVRVHEALRAQGLVLLGVNVESLPMEQLVDLVEQLEIAYPVVVPAGPLVGTFSDSSVLPYTWLIDREGRVRAAHGGFVTSSALERAVTALLAEP